MSSSNKVPKTTPTDDPAYGGTFAVWEVEPGRCWEVKGYDRRGNLLLHTRHASQHSMQMECEAWRSRGAREKFNG